MKIKIITDSSANFSLEEIEKMDLTVIAQNIIFGEESLKDGFELSPEQFYDRLTTEEVLPKTSQPSPEEFLSLFEEVKKNNEEAIVILISSQLSGTITSANVAKEMIDYDKIYIIDSLTTSIGLGILIEEAIRLKEAEKTALEIVEEINQLKEKIRIFAIVDTLDYLYRGGRLSKASAIVGNVLNVKPVLKLEDGKLIAGGKGYGTTRAITAILKNIKKEPINYNYPLYFGYNGSKEKMEQLIESVNKKEKIKEIKYKIISGVIGVHTGPNVCAIMYVTK